MANDSKNKALHAKMSSHDAVKQWKETGKKPKGLKKVALTSFFKPKRKTDDM